MKILSIALLATISSAVILPSLPAHLGRFEVEDNEKLCGERCFETVIASCRENINLIGLQTWYHVMDCATDNKICVFNKLDQTAECRLPSLPIRRPKKPEGITIKASREEIYCKVPTITPRDDLTSESSIDDESISDSEEGQETLADEIQFPFDP